jgi:hypothetical protein
MVPPDAMMAFRWMTIAHSWKHRKFSFMDVYMQVT